MLQQKLNSEIDLAKSQADLNRYKSILTWFQSLDAETKAKYSDQMAKASLDYLQNKGVSEKNYGDLLSEQKITEKAKQLNLKADTYRSIMQGINEGVKFDVLKKQIEQMDSQIKTDGFYRAYLSAAAGELEERKKLNTSNKELTDTLNKIKGYEAENWHNITTQELEKLCAETERIIAPTLPTGATPPLMSVKTPVLYKDGKLNM